MILFDILAFIFTAVSGYLKNPRLLLGGIDGLVAAVYIG